MFGLCVEKNKIGSDCPSGPPKCPICSDWPIRPSEKWTYCDLLPTYTNLVFVHFYILVYYGNFRIKPYILKYIHIDRHRYHIWSALAIHYCIMRYLLISILGLFIIDPNKSTFHWESGQCSPLSP